MNELNSEKGSNNVKYPLVSIIILSYNDRRYIQQILPIIKEKTDYPNYEIIIIDNGSSDNIQEDFKEPKKNILFKRIEKNIGFGRANNVGMMLARGKYILLLNADTFPQKNYLSPLVKNLENHHDIGMTGGYSINYFRKSDEVQPNSKLTQYEAAELIGAYLLFRKDLTLKNNIGKFDPFIHLYNEDKDLCYRTILHGYKVTFVTGSFIYHGRNLADARKIYTEYSQTEKNRVLTLSALYVVFKWFGIPYLILQSFLSLSSFLKSLFIKRNLYNSYGILKGFIDFLKNFSYIYHSREKLKHEVSNFSQRIKRIKFMKKSRVIDRFKHIDPNKYFDRIATKEQKYYGAFRVITVY